MSEKGTLYFFTGLAGAGKTTIGSLFYMKLRSRERNVVYFDGDEIRAIMGDGIGYTWEDRLRASMKRHFPLCKILTDQGIDVVTCNISMFSQVRNWNRTNISCYKEIYIRVPIEVLKLRDQKGLYSSGTQNVMGIDLPFDEPKTPDIIIENDGSKTPEGITEQLWKDLNLDNIIER